MKTINFKINLNIDRTGTDKAFKKLKRKLFWLKIKIKFLLRLQYTRNELLEIVCEAFQIPKKCLIKND